MRNNHWVKSVKRDLLRRYKSTPLALFNSKIGRGGGGLSPTAEFLKDCKPLSDVIPKSHHSQ